MARTRNDNKIINVAVSELRIHPVAQRRVVKSHLRRIAATLDLDAIGTIHVVHYAIKGVLAYWVIDGQHRVEALRHHGFGEWKVKAEIHQCDDDATASALFLKLNRRAAVGAFDLFANEVSSGDEAAVNVVEICAAQGLTVDRQARDGNIACVNALRSLWNIDQGETLGETLRVLVTAAGPKKDAVEGKLVAGLGRFLATFNGEVDREILATKIAKYPGGPAALLGNAKGLQKLRGNQSLASCVTEILVDVYNSGRRSGRIALK
jgi:hypothetical protein